MSSTSSPTIDGMKAVLSRMAANLRTHSAPATPASFLSLPHLSCTSQQQQYREEQQRQPESQKQQQQQQKEEEEELNQQQQQLQPSRSPPPPSRVIVVTDLREEAVVYVRGKPYVLRDEDTPRLSMKHVGITGAAVTAMERRLKQDILAEAQRFGGRILVHKEVSGQNGSPRPCGAVKISATGSGRVSSPGKFLVPAKDGLGDEGEGGKREGEGGRGGAQVVGYWQHVAEKDVMTPAEVFDGLKEGAIAGVSVEYRRIPLTRERAPQPSDVDEIMRHTDK